MQEIVYKKVSKSNSLPRCAPFTHGHSCVKIRLQPAPLCLSLIHICMVVFSILFGFGSCFFWPPVQNVISALTDLIATSGKFGLFLYGFLERFLIPTGLHHLIYTPVSYTHLLLYKGR